jgi:hypothetical protein
MTEGRPGTRASNARCIAAAAFPAAMTNSGRLGIS